MAPLSLQTFVNKLQAVLDRIPESADWEVFTSNDDIVTGLNEYSEESKIRIEVEAP